MTRAARRTALTLLTGALVAAAAAGSTGPAAAQASSLRARSGSRGGHSAGHSAVVPVSQAAAQAARPRAHPARVSLHPAAVTARQQAGVRRYWTRARMRHAVPLRPGRTRGAGRAGAARRAWLSAPLAATPLTAPLAIAPHTATQLTVAPRAAAEPLAVTARRSWLTAPLTAVPLTAAPRTAAHPLARAQLAAAANGALWTGGGAVARTTGKVFFSLGQHDYVCSASTVASANSDVVVTAAHCVKDGTGSWAANWTFVPGYANGKDPYGSYTAKRFYVASQWSTAADNNYDVAFVTVNPAVVDGSKVAVGREVGGQGIEFGRQPTRELAFGYPSDPPYSGQKLAYCSGKVSPDPYGATDDTGLRCPMTAGSSGGPWLTGFDRAAGTGIISSVSSFKYSTSDKILYGPPLGAAAQALYKAAEHG